MRKTLTALTALLVGLALSSCGSDEEPEDTTGGLEGEPIVLGMQSPDQGPSAFPEGTYGAEGAEWYINNVLGGVQGRPVEIEVCSGDGAPETGVKCANDFVAADIPLVFDGADSGSTGAMTPILKEAGIPIIGMLAQQGVAEREEYGTAFYFSGPQETSALGMVRLLSDLDLPKASLAIIDTAPAHGYVDQILGPMGEQLGLDIEGVYVEPENANFQVVAATELAADPDIAGVISLPEEGCTRLIQAIRQAGYEGTVFGGSCQAFIDDLGGESAAGAIIQPRVWLPRSLDHAPEAVQEELEAYADAMEAVGYEGEESSRAVYAFAGLVNTAKILNEIDGEITADSVTTAMKDVEDFQTFLGPVVTCDGKQWPEIPGVCNSQAIYFEVQEDGTMASVHDEGYIELDPDEFS